MKQPFTKVYCPVHKNEQTFYFVVDENGYPLPSYCDHASGAKVCIDGCAVKALKQLIAETEKRLEKDPNFFVNHRYW